MSMKLEQVRSTSNGKTYAQLTVEVNGVTMKKLFAELTESESDLGELVVVEEPDYHFEQK